jgi:hypothetical protein
MHLLKDLGPAKFEYYISVKKFIRMLNFVFLTYSGCFAGHPKTSHKQIGFYFLILYFNSLPTP